MAFRNIEVLDEPSSSALEVVRDLIEMDLSWF